MSVLPDVIDRFEEMELLVVGEAMLDAYLHGAAERLSQEAPVPVVSVGARRNAPGAAANVAANAAAFGARPVLVSVIGDDEAGAALRAALDEHDVSGAGLVVEPSRRTLAKNRVVSGSQLLVRFDEGDVAEPGTEAETALLAELERAWTSARAVVVSDYGYGVLGDPMLALLARLQAEAPRVVVVDSKRLRRYRAVGVTAVKPNYEQAVALVGAPGDEAPKDAIALYAEEILERTGARIVAITLDRDGALVLERGKPLYRTYARPRADTRATGAGDTFATALALGLAAGADTPAAAELASAAASIVVAKEGTAVCSAGELREYVAGEDKRVADVAALARRLDLYRSQGRSVVFTNGCFDILHRGHVTYLSHAKALGDVLVVGLNSDEGVRRLKGPARPINALEDRAGVLAALSCVDHIVPFGEDTPEALIRALRPDVFVKGGDYTRETLPEAPLVEALGGRVHLLPYVEERSTSGIIERIREANGAAAAPRG